MNSRIHARMSGTVKRAAGLTRRHSRLSILAAGAATAGVLGTAGFVIGSAPWSQAAGHPAATFDAAPGATVQLDSVRSAAGGSTVTAAAADLSDSATQQAVQPAVDFAKHAPARPAEKHVPAKHAQTHKHAKPYQIYDSVTPSALPGGKAAAVYANGAYATSASQVKGHKSVLWIDTNGSNPGANVLDVEPGDATPAGAAAWAQQRLTEHHDSVAIIYTMLSQWQQVKSHVAQLPKSMQANVRYWIADPTGVNHIVPGANATQWYWGSSIDISTANPSLTQVG